MVRTSGDFETRLLLLRLQPSRGLFDIKPILRAAKAEHSMVTVMSRHTIIEILGIFIHSAKRAVFLKAELERLAFLAIVKGGTYVTIIKDDYYNRSQRDYVPETH